MDHPLCRAVVATGVGGPEVLQVVQVPVGPPGPGEIRVDVRAAGVNPVDAKRYSGSYPAGSDFPMRLGFEAAGVVTAVGDGSVGAAGPVVVGDEVIAFRVSGAYADVLVVPGSTLVPKPAALTWEQAAGLMLAGTTAVHALTVTDVADGDTVLVHAAAGGVGVLLVQLAVRRGARVIGTASERNHELLRELGAEPVGYGDGLADRVRVLAPGGVDAAVDAAGTEESLAVSLQLVDRPERIAELVVSERSRQAGVRNLGGATGADPGTSVRDAARLQLAQMAGRGELRVPVAGTYPLGEAAQAHRRVLAGHAQGKLVLVP